MPDNSRKITLLKQLIKEMIENIRSEAKQSGKTTPGGGLTRAGAQRKIDKTQFMANARNAISGNDGDIEKAADQMGVAPRTFYYYLENEPKLQKVKDHIDVEVDKVEVEKERLQKSKEELEAEKEREKKP